jgi:hypothetical protein
MKRSELSLNGHVLEVKSFPWAVFGSHDCAIIKNSGAVAVRHGGRLSISALNGGSIFFALQHDSPILDIMDRLMYRQMIDPCLFDIRIIFEEKEVVNLIDCAFGIYQNEPRTFLIEFSTNMEYQDKMIYSY